MTKIFEHGNWSHNEQCPICGTNNDRQVVLIGIAGTESDDVMPAIETHLDCLLDALRYYPDGGIIGTIAPYPPSNRIAETEHED